MNPEGIATATGAVEPVCFESSGEGINININKRKGKTIVFLSKLKKTKRR